MTSRRGFTLIEVMLALAIGGVVVLLAHGFFGASADMSLTLDRSRAANDEVMTTRRVLTTLLSSADAADSASVGFRSLQNGMAFSSWRAGTLMAVRVELAGGRVTVFASDTVRLMRANSLAADYLLRYGADAAWTHGWESPASAPLAVRLRIARADSSGAIDTLLLVIGPHR